MAALCATLLVTYALPASAATTGLVRGRVSMDGAPKAGATITLSGEGATLHATSDARGAYVFSGVPFGHYRLSATAGGAYAAPIDFDLTSDSVVTLNFALSGFHGITYELDGAPIPLATSSNFSEIIDPKNVDSIEILTGAFPAEYGGSRQGAVVNIISDRANTLQQPHSGTIAGGVGNYGESVGSLDEAFKLGQTDVFFSANSQRTTRGLDTPTYSIDKDDSSQSDEFLRAITPLGARGTLSLDYSNQLSQYEIPINTDSNDPNDPVVSAPDTLDTQREYDRYANLNYTLTSKDGNGVFEFIPWYRYTRIAYDGDLANDVLATQPNPDTGELQNLIGLRQDRAAKYVGMRVSQFRASAHHAWKVGLDASRETFDSAEEFACHDSNCDGTGATGAPYYPFFTTAGVAGSQIGLYAQDKWSPSHAVSVSYGLRYDRSTGYAAGDMLSPRIGINVQADPKNVLHAYYGRFYAAPQLEDVRQACVAIAGCPTIPVYDLKPERDAYWEMGFSHTFGRGLTGYANYWNRTAVNVLDTTQLLDTPLFAVFNNARGRAQGLETRLTDRMENGDSWFFSGSISHAEAAGVSGSTFLFDPSDLADNAFEPEDHDQTYAVNAAYTHRFGLQRAWFATLQGEYGSGYPVEFQSGEGRLPVHTTLNLSLGKDPGTGIHKSLGFDLDLNNLLNHQYVIKIANGFNTTQIATGRSILLRVTAPL